MKKATILAIDDDPTVLGALKTVIEDAGHEVITAEAADLGISILKTTTPDLIILDMKMPGTSGAGFLRLIETPDGGLKYPVLVFTAFTNMKEFCESLDVDGVLLKPCDAKTLTAEIERILGATSSASATTKARDTKQKALAVDDDKDDLRKLSLGLETAGFEVQTADNGSDAIAKAIVSQPDVVVMKEIMSNMNGHAVVSLLNDIPKTKGIPVVLYEGPSSVAALESPDTLKTRGLHPVAKGSIDDIVGRALTTAR